MHCHQRVDILNPRVAVAINSVIATAPPKCVESGRVTKFIYGAEVLRVEIVVTGTTAHHLNAR